MRDAGPQLTQNQDDLLAGVASLRLGFHEGTLDEPKA
jgi:hypothetical protein